MIDFTIKTSDETEKFLSKVELKLNEPVLMLTKVGIHMVGSIDKNFKTEGRPSKWKGLAPMTKAFRRKGRGGGNFKILQDTGRLKNSIASKVISSPARKEVIVGTNVEYAPLMHFGGMSKPKVLRIPEHRRRITQAFGKPITPRTITVRAHDMKIGAKHIESRPFVMFQSQDIQALESIGLKHLEEAIK